MWRLHGFRSLWLWSVRTDLAVGLVAYGQRHMQLMRLHLKERHTKLAARALGRQVVAYGREPCDRALHQMAMTRVEAIGLLLDLARHLPPRWRLRSRPRGGVLHRLEIFVELLVERATRRLLWHIDGQIGIVCCRPPYLRQCMLHLIIEHHAARYAPCICSQLRLARQRARRKEGDWPLARSGGYISSEHRRRGRRRRPVLLAEKRLNDVKALL